MSTTTSTKRLARALIALVAVALAAGTSAALAGGEGRRDYASAELIQLGHGPGGPPPASVSSAARSTSLGSGRDYASPETVQLGHGPGGPPSRRS